MQYNKENNNRNDSELYLKGYLEEKSRKITLYIIKEKIILDLLDKNNSNKKTICYKFNDGCIYEKNNSYKKYENISFYKYSTDYKQILTVMLENLLKDWLAE